MRVYKSKDFVVEYDEEKNADPVLFVYGLIFKNLWPFKK